MFSLKWLSHLRITFLCRFRMAGAGRSDFTPSEIKILQKPSPREIWSANSLLHMQDSSRKGFQWKESRSVTFVLVAYPSWVSGYPGIRVSIPSIIYSITFTLPWFNPFLEAICLLSDTLPLGPASQKSQNQTWRLFFRHFFWKALYLVLQKSNAEETAVKQP